MGLLKRKDKKEKQLNLENASKETKKAGKSFFKNRLKKEKVKIRKRKRSKRI